MKLSEETKIGLRKIFWLILFWVVYLQLIIFFVYLYLLHFGSAEYIQQTLPEYNFTAEILVSTIFAVAGGAIFGSIEVFYFKRFAKKTFLWNLMVKGLAYVFFIIVLIVTASSVYNSLNLDQPFYEKEVIFAVSEYLKSGGALYNVLVVSIGILISIFLIQIDMKLGQKGLKNLVSARYFHPIEEHRIFMFIDIKSATEIAEKLGHIRYFQLLNDFFADATKPILNTRGTIYQYIGDEISISWVVNGELMNPDCLNCFFGIEQIIIDRASYYQEKYNLVPKFKGGIHFGPVTTGQIGLIKKEIVHSGDVLNTASRIQNLCNQNDAKLIISGATLEKFKNMEAYQLERIGNIALKGKSQRQELFKVEKIN